MGNLINYSITSNMKFFALAALVATTQAAATVATGAVCVADADFKTATDSCCQSYKLVDFAEKKQMECAAATTKDATAAPFIKSGCKGRTAGAASLAATAAAAATALYAMC